MINFQNLPPTVKNIILINVGVFIVAHLLFPQLNGWISAYYPLSKSFKIWQVITHMFAHAGWMHLIFNMFTLFSFGPVIEQVLGQKKFISFYFACGLGAFLLFNIWNFIQIQQLVQVVQNNGINAAEVFANADTSYITHSYYAQFSSEEKKILSILLTPMLGASGAIFGVMTAFAMLFPNASLFFMFIPFPIKAKYLLPIIIIISLYLGFSQLKGDNIAHFAHLGGAIVGYFWIRHWKKRQTRI